MKFPEYETKRLTLRKLTEDDAEGIFQLFSDSLVITYYDMEALSDISQAKQIIHLMQERFESNTGIRWGIRIAETNELVGTCGFNSWNKDMKSAVIGYDLRSHFWGRGIITEAIHQIVKQAFGGGLPCGDLNRIQADTVPGNIGSELVLKKVGFKEEGLRRQCGYWKNQFHDLKCFGLLRSEYKEV
ncbi:GNAT family N-acetyltransferase [Photobacterium sp. 53610]|uniref:GNAT family N-acetyltransferase n=1 Tax=Photobacterium sp. 53610 TaxID=3102789 RepID=UPI002EDACF4F